MKARLLTTAILGLLVLSSCNYFKNHRLFSRGVDSVLDMTIEQPEQIVMDTAEYLADEGSLTEPVFESEPEPVYASGNARYFMIVGSFQNQNLAKSYAEKIREMGYQSQVIEANNGFYRVSARSYGNFQQGISEIPEFRSSLSTGSWLHVKN